MYVCMYVRMYVCMHVCMYVWYVYMCVVGGSFVDYGSHSVSARATVVVAVAVAVRGPLAVPVPSNNLQVFFWVASQAPQPIVV